MLHSSPLSQIRRASSLAPVSAAPSTDGLASRQTVTASRAPIVNRLPDNVAERLDGRERQRERRLAEERRSEREAMRSRRFPLVMDDPDWADRLDREGVNRSLETHVFVIAVASLFSVMAGVCGMFAVALGYALGWL